MLFSRKTELVRLVKKVLDGKATLKEKEFIKKYYDYFEKAYRPSELSSNEKKKIEERILKKIDVEIDRARDGKIKSLFDNWYLRIAAACFFLVSVGGLYYWYHAPEYKSKDNMISQKRKFSKEDVLPGGNKAVLTLSNGSTIVLDSVHNGKLATQGGSSILKLNSGKLVYNHKTGADRIIKGNTSLAETQYNTLTTPRGGQYQIRLPDGTKVWLNSASSLTFPISFTSKERSVTLTGEAYFEVTKDKNKPFMVSVGGMKITVLGTHFNVMAYNDEPAVKATLLEGAVKVTKGNNSALLQPGQQAIISSAIADKIKVKEVNTEKIVAWKNGFFSFHRTNIYEIMRQISRWYDVEISYKDSLNVFLNGTISRDVNVSKVFKMLKLTGELNFTIVGKKIIVRKD